MTNREYLFNLHKQRLQEEALFLPLEKTGRNGRDRGWFIYHAREALNEIERICDSADPYMDRERKADST